MFVLIGGSNSMEPIDCMECFDLGLLEHVQFGGVALNTLKKLVVVGLAIEIYFWSPIVTGATQV